MLNEKSKRRYRNLTDEKREKIKERDRRRQRNKTDEQKEKEKEYNNNPTLKQTPTKNNTK